MDRPPVPEALKRGLRQEAAFGCCFCGYPFIEYHHIEPYTDKPIHDARTMMVVCPNHHHQCTVGAISEERQQQAKVEPFNKVRGYVNGQFVTDSKVVAVAMGSNLFVGAGFKFVVDGEPLLELRRDPAGRLLLSICLRDAEDNLLLSIVENDWITGEHFPWDLEYGFNIVRLRCAERKIALTVNARATTVDVRGELWRKRQQLSVSGSQLKFDGVRRNLAFMGIAFVGMSLTVDTQKGTLDTRPYGGVRGGLLALPYSADALRLAVEAFEDQCREAPVEGDAACPCGSERKFRECHQPAG
jgi:hypothetical protein